MRHGMEVPYLRCVPNLEEPCPSIKDYRQSAQYANDGERGRLPIGGSDIFALSIYYLRSSSMVYKFSYLAMTDFRSRVDHSSIRLD